MPRTSKSISVLSRYLAFPILWVISTNVARSDQGRSGDYYTNHPHSMWMDHWGGAHSWMPISILLIAILLIAITLWLTNRGKVITQSGPPPENSEDNPMEILRARFARGEINADEYEARKRVLSQ